MSKNIRLDLYIENNLMQEFFNIYMPIDKSDSEIIDMFLEDEDYSIITDNREEMKRKLQGWAKFYREQNKKKQIPNYNYLKKEMKKIIMAYGFNNNDAKEVFVSHLIYSQGIQEEEAYKIANLIIKDIQEEHSQR